MYDDLDNEMNDMSDSLREVMEQQQQAKRDLDDACTNLDSAERDYYAAPSTHTLKRRRTAQSQVTARQADLDEIVQEFEDAWRDEFGGV